MAVPPNKRARVAPPTATRAGSHTQRSIRDFLRQTSTPDSHSDGSHFPSETPSNGPPLASPGYLTDFPLLLPSGTIVENPFSWVRRLHRCIYTIYTG